MTEKIRIKFTPFVKHVPNASCCWLEIIPTVSCMEHLDKIEWKQQTLSMEYIVPLTYKIILRKKEPEKQKKMYYSCIDLLSSISSHDLCSGDIHRHISENIILSKVVTEGFKDKYFGRTYQKADLLVTNKAIETDHVIVPEEEKKKNTYIETDNTNKQEEHKSIVDYSIRRDDLIVTNNKIDKSTGDDNNIKEQQETLKYSKLSTINTNRDEKLPKKLCITPICKINTADNIFLCNNRVNIGISAPRLKPKEDRSSLNIVNQVKNTKLFYANNSSFYNSIRLEPNIRIAHFVQKMEEEVFPLKLLLDELLRKCSSLGLNKNKSSEYLYLNRYSPIKRLTNKTCDVQRDMYSNRVVYSFVFDK